MYDYISLFFFLHRLGARHSVSIQELALVHPHTHDSRKWQDFFYFWTSSHILSASMDSYIPARSEHHHLSPTWPESSDSQHLYIMSLHHSLFEQGCTEGSSTHGHQDKDIWLCLIDFYSEMCKSSTGALPI